MWHPILDSITRGVGQRYDHAKANTNMHTDFSKQQCHNAGTASMLTVLNMQQFHSTVTTFLNEMNPFEKYVLSTL